MEHRRIVLCHAFAEIASDAEALLVENRHLMAPDQIAQVEALAKHGYANALAQASWTAQ